MEEDNAKLLQTYKHDLEMYSTQLKQKVLECKEALQRGSNIDIFDTGCEIHSSVTLPVKPTLGTVSFTPNGSPQCHLKHALGEMDVSDQGQGQSFKGHDQAGQKGQFIQQQRSGPNVKTPYTQQRSAGRRKGPRTKILGELESPCNIDCICPGTEGRMWTSAHNSDTLIQLDKQGKIVQEVKHNAKIKDISLSPTTNILWACDEEKYITELVSGRLVQRFKNTEEPQCICITASKHVVLGAPKHIKKFTANGELVLSTMAAGIGKAYTPHRISECPVTHNIAVVNLSDGKHVGKNQQVIVMDTDFKELFRYGSEDLDTHQPKAQSEVFDPWNVAYDSGGRLVIGDRKNKRVLLISGRGEFLRNLHRDVYWTTAVGIDREDILWVMFGSCNIKLLKYST
ncbi:uncharacterized protein LOC132552397 [Ylistrum balloti]|uniref:uncharacterized protein LOC132552397 n=1 Tax=Ylistrum balloti TaxID=509963 RepID=UPI002905EB43|nr:uncharacterized protein LOC132552397 [Ylistrum balloti]